MSDFRKRQTFVAFGMAGGAALTGLGLALPWIWDGFPSAPAALSDRAMLWVAVSAVTGIWMIVSIARLARHRFFHAQDIDAGAAATAGSAKAAALQSQLQNTLEQTVIAVLAQGAWLALAPPQLGMVAILFAGYFALGRAMFLLGYSGGAPSRALGFALTFYPSVALLLGSMPWALARIAAAI